MFLSREIDIELCRNYTKSYIYQISYKIRSIKQTIFNKYATNLKTTIYYWDSQVSAYTPFHFSFTVPLKTHFVALDKAFPIIALVLNEYFAKTCKISFWSSIRESGRSTRLSSSNPEPILTRIRLSSGENNSKLWFDPNLTPSVIHPDQVCICKSKAGSAYFSFKQLKATFCYLRAPSNGVNVCRFRLKYTWKLLNSMKFNLYPKKMQMLNCIHGGRRGTSHVCFNYVIESLSQTHFFKFLYFCSLTV